MNFYLQLSIDEILQSIEAVRKGIGEFNRAILIGLEEIFKVEFVSGVLIFLVTAFIADIGAAASPFVGLFRITVADLHFIII